MATRPLKLGFVGAGAMGQCAHLRHYASRSDCHVVALAELRPELGWSVARRYGIERVYSDHRALLEAENDLDGVVAIQPFELHGQILPAIYEAGIPVLTEKPLSAFASVGERLVESLAGSGARHYVAYHKRSDPATEWTVAEIDRLRASGELGPLRYVRLTMPPGDFIAGGFAERIVTDEEPPELAADPAPSGMSDSRRERLRQTVNFSIHQLDLMRHLMREPYELAHVAGRGLLLLAKSAGGVPGVLEAGPFRTTRGWDEAALVAFERGWVHLELPAPLALNTPGRVTVYRDPGPDHEPQTVMPRLPPVGAMQQQATNFLEAIRGAETPLCEAEEALADLRTAETYVHWLEEEPDAS